MNKLSKYTIYIILLFIWGCGSSQEITQEEVKEERIEEPVYVFDDIESDTVKLQRIDAYQFENKDVRVVYYVQIGAFSKKESAEKFSNDSIKDLKEDFIVKYNSTNGLWVVLFPREEERKRAEEIRNKVWKNKKYSDAFIYVAEEEID